MKIRYYMIFLVCLLLPITLIFFISLDEIKANRVNSSIAVVQMAYGTSIPVRYGEIRELVPTHGLVTSRHYIELDVPTSLNGFIDRLLVGQEFTRDELIASSTDDELRAPVNALLKEILYDVNGQVSLVMLDLDQLSLDLYFPTRLSIDSESVYEIELDNQMYTLTNGKRSNIYAEQGYKVEFDIIGEADRLSYFQTVEGLFMTGRQESSILMVPVSSVYISSLNGMPAVRVVSVDGVFIEERNVQLGIQDLDYIAIIGLAEGLFVDDGSAQVYGYEASEWGY